MITDQPYIEQIRKRLWSGREFGQAAVMVGAGFSRNADKLLPSTPPFPLWNELAKHMSAALYPAATPPPVSTLRLATEYETVFGRASLDNLVTRTIPDSAYSPGQLHRLLLSLPWSDMFTTNYDTLLERTRPSIHDRKYELVLTASDILGRIKPRIVKLHGSFPSHRPFIVSEEDYRTYPSKFAPFVNIVQQSIMENAFCLIGFSGDDPNFLHWTGWVRDNLGESTPPIYLCSLTPVSISQRRVLESRYVYPIDLSTLISPTIIPDDSSRFAKSLEWFLLTLMDGAPPNVNNFPHIRRNITWMPSNGVPPLPPRSESIPELGERSLSANVRELEIDALRSLQVSWQQQRAVYPNWEVLPSENRETFWDYTEGWVETVLNSLHKLPAPENLFLLYELNWRLERCLLPIITDWVQTFVSTVNAFNPFPGLMNVEGATIRPDLLEHRMYDWGRIGDCWVALNFALIREARERGDESRFRELVDGLKEVVEQQAEWQARWSYEQCLFWLFRIDFDSTRAVLAAWSPTPNLPFWETKRASVLAEVGELNEAERVAEESLDAIRSRQQPFEADYALLSQEGWTMLLLKGLKDNRIGESRDTTAQYRDRWEKLESYRCNPWSDVERAEMVINAIDPTPTPLSEVRRGFHPRSRTTTYHLLNPKHTDDLRRSFAFLRMFEEGAMPFRCNAIAFFSEAVVNAAKCIASAVPHQALSAMLRTLADKQIKEWFDYTRIATLAPEEVSYLYTLSLNSFIQAAHQLQTAGTGRRTLLISSTAQIRTLIFAELLSRLCLRLSSEQLEQIFQIAKDAYTLPIFRGDIQQQECPGTLFAGLLDVLSQERLLQLMPELLRLPLPTEQGFEVSEPQRWREPFRYIDWNAGTRLAEDFDRTAWTAPITNLIRVVRDGTAEARARAVLRLSTLHDLKALSAEEEAAFGAALWSRLDPDKGLPTDTELHDFAFMRLPSPDPEGARTILRESLNSRDFPRIVHRTTEPDGRTGISMGIGGTRNFLIHEWLGATGNVLADGEDAGQHIDWTIDEAVQLLVKAAAWWDDEKSVLTERGTGDPFDFAGALREQFSQLVKLLSRVVLPRLAAADGSMQDLARRILREMDELGIVTAPALPSMLYVEPSSQADITRKLRAGLYSADEKTARYATIGIFHWYIGSRRGSLPAPQNDLLGEVIGKIVARKEPALASAISHVISLLTFFPDLFRDDQLNDLCLALEYLIAETAIDQPQGEPVTDACASIAFYDRPYYRELSVRLASKLNAVFTAASRERPSVLTEWRDIASRDPLPKVRQAWE